MGKLIEFPKPPLSKADEDWATKVEAERLERLRPETMAAELRAWENWATPLGERLHPLFNWEDACCWTMEPEPEDNKGA